MTTYTIDKTEAVNLIIGDMTSDSPAESDKHNIYLLIPKENMIDDDTVKMKFRGEWLEEDLFSLVLRLLEHESIHIAITRNVSALTSHDYDKVSPYVDGI